MQDSSAEIGGTIRWGDFGPFGIVPENVIVSDLSDRAVRLYALLARYAMRPGGIAEESKRGLAKAIGCAPSTLDTAMRELVAAGLVEAEERRGANGVRLANGYRISLGSRDVPPEQSGGGSPEEPGGNARVSQPDQEDPQEKTNPDRLPAVRGEDAPKPRKVGGRRLDVDALAEVCSIREGSPRLREAGVAAAKIRAIVWREIDGAGFEDPEQFERQLAIEIRARATLYRRKMPGAALTPGALAKWWIDLPGMPDPGAARSGVSAEDLFAEAERLRREGSE